MWLYLLVFISETNQSELAVRIIALLFFIDTEVFKL